MRRQTQWALGGVLAGTVLLGVTGTLAVFTDTESVSTAVGAGSLAMEVTAQPNHGSDLRLRSRPQGTVVVVNVAVTGGGGVVSLSVDGSEGGCADLPPALLTVTVDGIETTRHFCDLAGEALPLIEVPAGASDTDVVLRVTRDPDAPTNLGADPTTSRLRLTVAQPAGGFSDTATIDVDVLTPPANGAQNANGGPR